MAENNTRLIGIVKNAARMAILQSGIHASNAVLSNQQIPNFQSPVAKSLPIGTAMLAGQREISQSEQLALNATPPNRKIQP